MARSPWPLPTEERDDPRRARSLLCVVVVGTVLWGGATHAPATWALGLAAGATLLLTLVEARGAGTRLPPLGAPLLVLLAWCGLQLVPLPPPLKALLSPQAARIERLVLGGLDDGRWRPLAVDAAATIQQAAILAGLLALALALDRCAGERGRRALRRLVLAALAALLLPALASAVGLPVPRAIVPLPSTRALLAFPLANPNHAAALLALGLPLALALAAGSSAREEPVVRYLAAALVCLGNAALVFTLSRAGIALGLAAQALWLWRLSRRRGRGAQALLGAAIIPALLALAVAATPLLGRLRPAAGDDGRLQAWRDGLRLLADHLVAGVGRGGFPFAFARYSQAAARLRYDFVESEPLQALIDLGAPGALLLGAALLLALRAALDSWSSRTPRTVAAALGLAALALHGTVDFAIEMGGVAAVACVVAAVAFPDAGWRVPRAAPWTAGALAIGLSLIAASPLARTADDDAARLRQAARAGAPAAELDRLEADAFVRHPADALLAERAAERLLRAGDPAAFGWLRRALILGPRDLAAHELTALALVGSGQAAQAAGELRFVLAEAGDADRGRLVAEAVALFGRGDGALLVDAVPADGPLERSVREAVLAQLLAERRWPALERLGLAALVDDDGDAAALRAVVTAGVELGHNDALRERARRLAQVDRSPEAARLAARALTAAGDGAGADGALAAAIARAPTPESATELAIDRAHLATERGDLPTAAAALDAALERAVAVRDKGRLHRELAAVDDRLGNLDRAAYHRAQAERLTR